MYTKHTKLENYSPNDNVKLRFSHYIENGDQTICLYMMYNIVTNEFGSYLRSPVVVGVVFTTEDQVGVTPYNSDLFYPKSMVNELPGIPESPVYMTIKEIREGKNYPIIVLER